MDAMDVLGALLGKKQGGGGLGGAILKNIIQGKRSSGRAAPSPPKRQAPSPERSPVNPSPAPQRQAPSDALPLDDLLREAFGHHRGRASSPDASRRRATTSRPAPSPPSRPAPSPSAPTANQDQAMVLLRAMVNAAKSDGQLDDREQQAIFQQLGNVSQDTLRFLQSEFAKPLDVRQFAWDVPLGLEEQVYSLSVMAIDLDENKEARYLHDLAHGLRLDPETCNDIHRQLDAPTIF